MNKNPVMLIVLIVLSIVSLVFMFAVFVSAVRDAPLSNAQIITGLMGALYLGYMLRVVSEWELKGWTGE